MAEELTPEVVTTEAITPEAEVPTTEVVAEDIPKIEETAAVAPVGAAFATGERLPKDGCHRVP